jgi:hypothetical protein
MTSAAIDKLFTKTLNEIANAYNAAQEDDQVSLNQCPPGGRYDPTAPSNQDHAVSHDLTIAKKFLILTIPV